MFGDANCEHIESGCCYDDSERAHGIAARSCDGGICSDARRRQGDGHGHEVAGHCEQGIAPRARDRGGSEDCQSAERRCHEGTRRLRVNRDVTARTNPRDCASRAEE